MTMGTYHAGPKELRSRIKGMVRAPIAKLRDFAAGNPKLDRPEDLEVLDASLEENGYSMLVVVREVGEEFEILDGHARVALIRKNYPGTTHIDVLVLDVATAAEGRKLILGFKRTRPWDMTALDAWVAHALKNGELALEETMRVSGLNARDLDSLARAGEELLAAGGPLPGTGPPAPKPKARQAVQTRIQVREVDLPEEPPKKATTQPGQVWLLGDHRLVCGDMLVPEVMDAALEGAMPALIVTQPEPSDGKKGWSFQEYAEALAEACEPGCVAYMVTQPLDFGPVDVAMRAAGFNAGSMIIWGKNSVEAGRKDYQSQHQPIWYGWREGAPRRCAPTDRGMSDLWSIDRPRKTEAVPSALPMTLVARAINASSQARDRILDTFGGSGSVLLAAEATGRVASVIEVDPRCCDVIVRRWETLTGRKAELLNE